MLTIAIGHLFSVLSFFVDDIEKYETNPKIHSINTRHKHDICLPNVNPSSYQKGMYCAGTKQYRAVPSSIKIFHPWYKSAEDPLVHSWCI